MSQSVQSLETGPGGWLAGYRPPCGAFDEVTGPDGTPRPAWREFVGRLDEFGPLGIAHQADQMRRLLRESGLSYSLQQSPREPDGRWDLDPIPWLLPKAEWNELSAGLAQRARLLNRILMDLYGPQELLRAGLLPADLVFGQPGFLLPCHAVEVPGNIFLHLYAAKLVRGPDGRWMVAADRTQAPSGPGFAVENRIVLSRTLPGEYHRLHVERVASFFIALRQTLQSLAPHHRENPRIVVLSNGPRAATYIEDAYLARYLGYTLVEGGDLTVRGTSVYLKTLGGLLPVDVILRRQADDLCDPLELKGYSQSGVPGLVESARHGQVLVANALGSGFLESPAMAAFLPAVCRYLLGEELRLGSVPAWWCANPDDRRYVCEHLGELVIHPVVFRRGERPIVGAELDAAGRQALLDRIAARPAEFVAQSRIVSSTLPVWSQGSLRCWHASLKAYAAASPDGSYTVMPGGLARVLPGPDGQIEPASGLPIAKDAWVLSDGPVARVTLLRSSATALDLRRSGNDLPSRVADNLYWLGRHVERAEGMVRHLRSCVSRLTGEFETSNLPELPVMVRALSLDLAAPLPPDSPAACPVEGLEDELVSFLFQPSRPGAFYETLREMYRIASTVRDRLSLDTWRIVNQTDLDLLFPGPKDQGRDRPRLGDVLMLLNQILNLLSAFSGMGMESMTRGPGWRFLDMGRRMERALNTLRLLRAMLVRPSADPLPFLEAVLEIADSTMTYRYRYLTSLQLAPVLDLLLVDETNPRSVGFQVTALSDHVRELPSKEVDLLRNRETRLVLATQTALRLADIEPLTEAEPDGVHHRLQAFLEQAAGQLLHLSDSITHTYFTHTGPSRPLGTPQDAAS